jgi:hypothetical protein
MCVSINGIIRLIESVCLGPKVIPLSGVHCSISNLVNSGENTLNLTFYFKKLIGNSYLEKLKSEVTLSQLTNLMLLASYLKKITLKEY